MIERAAPVSSAADRGEGAKRRDVFRKAEIRNGSVLGRGDAGRELESRPKETGSGFHRRQKFLLSGGREKKNGDSTRRNATVQENERGE